MADWKPEGIDLHATPVAWDNFGFVKAMDTAKKPAEKVVILHLKKIDDRSGNPVDLPLALSPSLAVQVSQALHTAGIEAMGEVH